MQMTSLGLPVFSSGVVTSRMESSDFLSRWLVGGGGPLVDTKVDREFSVGLSLTLILNLSLAPRLRMQ